MVSKISAGIKVSVEVYYQPDYSNPFNNEYMFAYRITIENNNAFAVKLLTRHWIIFDSNGEHREVDGEGVVGQQPIINAGQQFQYSSGCNLRTEIGKMHGTYTLENLNNKQQFTVNIPAFQMIVPTKYN
ncbi:MAG: Co2+/Mg2+ efflux protein ApaG [Deinococcales bacterium]|nr:Co2+/Mg2+ efflux protein ApaG [Chitinophagaceae bacterium]